MESGNRKSNLNKKAEKIAFIIFAVLIILPIAFKFLTFKGSHSKKDIIEAARKYVENVFEKYPDLKRMNGKISRLTVSENIKTVEVGYGKRYSEAGYEVKVEYVIYGIKGWFTMSVIVDDKNRIICRGHNLDGNIKATLELARKRWERTHK